MQDVQSTSILTCAHALSLSTKAILGRCWYFCTAAAALSAVASVWATYRRLHHLSIKSTLCMSYAAVFFKRHLLSAHCEAGACRDAALPA